MNTTKLKQLGLILSWCVAALSPLQSHAQAGDGQWPSKPVRLVVTFPPGGSADSLSRILSTRLAKELGQAVIVDNRAGAGGSIGTAVAAKAAPDGYTFLVAAGGSLVVNPLLAKQSYDTLKDFVPVAQLVSSPFAPAINRNAFDNKVQDVQGLAEHIRTHRGALSFASGGNGTQMHLVGELFNQVTKGEMVHVPYKGGGPAIIDLIGGSIPIAFVDLASITPSLGNDKIKVLAVSSSKRSPIAPDVPSAVEAGLPQWQAGGWIGLLAPAKTPTAIVQRMETEINKVLREKAVIDQVLQSGNEAAPSTSVAFRSFIESESRRWKAVVDTAGIKAQP